MEQTNYVAAQSRRHNKRSHVTVSTRAESDLRRGLRRRRRQSDCNSQRQARGDAERKQRPLVAGGRVDGENLAP